MRGDIGCGLQMVWYNSCQSMVMSVNGYILTKGEMRSVQSLFKLGRRKVENKERRTYTDALKFRVTSD